MTTPNVAPMAPIEKKSPDRDNPRRLRTAVRAFAEGTIGHYFSRPLNAEETDLLRGIQNHHGSCIFFKQEFEGVGAWQAVGAWLCTCNECELLVAALAAEARINIISHQAGEKNFVLLDESNMEIQIQQVGTAAIRRRLDCAYVAAQVAAEVAAKFSATAAAAIRDDVVRIANWAMIPRNIDAAEPK